MSDEYKRRSSGLITFLNDKMSFRSIMGLVVAILGIGLSMYVLYAAYFGQPEAHVHRTTYLSVLLILALLLYPLKRNQWNDAFNKWILIDFLLIGIILGTQIYVYMNSGELALRHSRPTDIDIIIGTLFILTLLEATRRTVGWAMTIIVSVFLIQPIFSNHLFWIFYGPPVSWQRMVGLQVLSTDGIFGLPIMAMASFISLFILFGTILSTTGAGNFFMKFALSLTGRQVGGPAKASIISSGMMGSISGSAVGNVVTTGSFTIPLMKKLGYKKSFAGAVEASASSGGQIMPPVMGTAAFLIAVIMGVSYFDVVMAGIIPAILYFFSLYMMVHFRSKKRNIGSVSPDAVPNLLKVLKEDGFLLLPLIAIVTYLAMGFTVMKAAFWGIITLFIIVMVVKKSRLTFIRFLDILEKGSRAAVPVGVACASAGIIIGSIFLSGIGLNLSGMIISLGQSNLLLTLMFTMVTAIILGMGLTTVAVYMTLSSLIIPSLIQLGVEPMSAHFFAFYFGVFSAITPPVALAAFAAAAISGETPMRTGVEAFKVGIAAFIIPFMVVYGPELLLIGEPKDIALTSLTAVMGIICLTAGTQGWFRRNLYVWQRIVLLVSAILLIIPENIYALIGGLFMVAIYFVQVFEGRQVVKQYDEVK